MTDYKSCKVCNTLLEATVENFRPHPNGLRPTCRKCENEKVRARIKNGCVYQIYNTVTNDFYIGETSRLKGRWHSHLSLLRRGIHDNTRLQQAWNKYGESAFELKVIEHTADHVTRELYWIEQLKPAYNLDYVENGQVKHPEETKRKIQKANKGQIPWTKGKTHEEISGVEGAAKRRAAFIAMNKSRKRNK